MKPPRLRDVAAMAGVAPSTVSVVLNEVETARVSDATRQRVREAAAALAYTPNAAARRLRTTTDRTLALVADDLGLLPYGLGLINGVYQACWARGVRVLLLPTGGDAARERDALQDAAGQQVEGTILASVYHDRREVPRARNLVLLNLEPEQGSVAVPYVVPTEDTSAALVVDELVTLGHRRVALATTSDGLEPVARAGAFRRAWARHGMPLEDLLIDESSPYDATSEGGRLAAARLLTQPAPPTAIATHNDRMAMGVYQAAQEHGLSVPDDLTVIGHDNLEPIAESLFPALTTVALPHEEMAECAVRIALGEDRETGPRTFQGELLRRASATAPRACASVVEGGVAPV